MDKTRTDFLSKGRASNMIGRLIGRNIYPEDIESILNQHELVTESLVIQQEGRLVALCIYKI